MQKEEEAEVSKAATIVDTRIVTPAEIPLSAITPQAMTTVLSGLFLGVFAGNRARFDSMDDFRALSER